VSKDTGIDVAPGAAALDKAGLMPPVLGLHVHGEPADGNEVLLVDVLLPCGDDLVTKIERTLSDVRYELRYIMFDEDGRRPGADYRPT
jgi:hypothetical protein